MDHLVVDRPEAVEIEHLLVPGSNSLHLSIFLVTDNMIDVEKLGDWNESIENLSLSVLLEAGKEGASVVDALDEGMDSVAVGLDASNDHGTILVLESLWLSDSSSATFHCLGIDTCSIINCESNIFDTVTVLGVVRAELSVIRIQRRLEGEGQLVLANNVGAHVTLSSFETLTKKAYGIDIRLFLN